MSKSMKAALLSALIFPGTGHLYLRSYARGIILLAICTIALIDFMRRALQQAELIRAQLTTEINAGGAVDIENLVAHATTAVDQIDHQPFTLATIVLFACWLFGIWDSYRIGQQLEKTSPAP
jgi:hypothetical protein